MRIVLVRKKGKEGVGVVGCGVHRAREGEESPSCAGLLWLLIRCGVTL